MMHFKHFNDLSAAEIYEILRVREAVFTLEQGVDCADIDSLDTVSFHLWEGEEDRIHSYLRIIPPATAYPEPSIGRVLTAPHHRRCGLSRKLMATAIDSVRKLWAHSDIVISAQAYLVEFYGSLGFEIISDEYPDGGIGHYKMFLRAETK